LDVRPTDLPGVLVIEPRVFEDERGFFCETWNANAWREATGRDDAFVQDNHSRSMQGVLRGLHYQLPRPQGKLVRCVVGAVWDVAVDIRRSSPTFGKWVGYTLTADNRLQLWVPEGFAHGFIAQSAVADVAYKTTEFYVAEADRVVRWDDPRLAIDWPLAAPPILSAKDAAAPMLGDAVLFD
jgi:dTDP-4-dehydrorhamnose 3,5-epimerase